MAPWRVRGIDKCGSLRSPQPSTRRYKIIRLNGKVERSHRKDNEMFYAKKTFYSLEDYNKQLRRYMNEYNNFPMRPLGWKSPNEFLSSFFSNV